MRAHVIENGVVVNTIVVDSLDFMPNLVEATAGGIGWSYVNGQFINPNPPVESTEEPQFTREELLAQINALAAQVQSLPEGTP
jgi:hypothetical protein